MPAGLENTLNIFVLISEDGLRQRNVAEDTTKDLDTVLKHHNQVQEKLAEEMVSLARNLKENARAANRIISDDNKVLVYCCCSCNLEFSMPTTFVSTEIV